MIWKLTKSQNKNEKKNLLLLSKDRDCQGLGGSRGFGKTLLSLKRVMRKDHPPRAI